MNVELRSGYILNTFARPKPVMNVDALLIALTHHWAHDIFSFSIERQRVQLPLILLTAAYTSFRPDELVDAAKDRRSHDPHISLWKQAICGNEDELCLKNSDQLSGDERRCKPLCYKDLTLRLLKNSNCEERQILTVDVYLRYHKECDGNLKPYVKLYNPPLPTNFAIVLPSCSTRRMIRFFVHWRIYWH